MKKLIMLLMLSPLMGLAQEKGTHFEHGLSWTQVKEKAKKEHKYLLVDCFTTWCGPCKYMTANVFPQEKVGTFLNKNFVNVKVQFDKTNGDSEEVKSWYKDAEAIEKTYSIKAYPTFLIFSPNGELVHRMVGGNDADGFIAETGKALNPKTQYYTLLKAYEAGDMAPEGIKQLAVLAEQLYDEANAAKLTAAYLKTQPNLYTKENLELLSQSIKDTKSKGFELLLNNREKVDPILGKAKVDETLGKVILQDDLSPNLTTDVTNVDSVIAAVRAKYPSVDINQVTDFCRILFYYETKNWVKLQPTMLAYVEKYDKDVFVVQLNFLVDIVFANYDDQDFIAAALVWSKRAADETQYKESYVLASYANLLYKAGKKEEAMGMVQQVIDLVPGDTKAAYQNILDKMKKGEKIWI